MSTTDIYIKNMVCPRCIKVVKTTLENLGHEVNDVQLGKAVVQGKLEDKEISSIGAQLKEEGFLLIDDRKQQLVEAIKNIVVDTVHYGQLSEMTVNFSTLLAEKLLRDYHYLSNLFSEQEGTTIEQYIIQQKIELVKELLAYNELNLSEIAYKLGYSSVAHLSAQFKKVTGITPSQFKQQKGQRIPLDKL